MRIEILIFLVIGLPGIAEPQALSVCEVLDHLPELNGKTIRVRGALSRHDNGTLIWASSACPHPIVYDGWTWREIISVIVLGAGPELQAELDQWSSIVKGLKGRPEHSMILATLTGRLETRDHFHVRLSPHVPKAYAGFFVAQMTCWKIEDLQAMPFTAAESERARKMGENPFPARVKKGN